MTFKEFNNLTQQEANSELEKCCVSKSWTHNMVGCMPFASVEKLLHTTAGIWYDQCGENDWKEAFTGHPKIGDINSLRAKFANTKEWANNEQAKVVHADDAVIKALSEANEKYLEKFGYIFIVSASGRSAKEIFAIINLRLDNSAEHELYIAMGEQHKITVIRLVKLIDDLKASADLRSHITTHVLDTSTGIPGEGMPITLKGFVDNKWQPITVGVTNNDGRIADLLPPGKNLEAGNYQMHFDTAAYYKSKQQKGFYPDVTIEFTVTDHEHYHIPLLINPYGYTTYKGS